MKAALLSYNWVPMKRDVQTGNRIRQLRKQLDLTQGEFADRMGGVTRGAVGNWELGKGIKRDNLVRIAETFGSSVDWLATGNGQPLAGDNPQLTTNLIRTGKMDQVQVTGFVKGGVWQDMTELGGDDGMHEFVPSSSDYPAEWQFALIVDGNSINRVANHGDRLVCLDLVKSRVDIQDGDLVIIERRRFGGQMVQRTAKRVRQTTRGYELWPDSTDPAHQETISYETDRPDEDSVIVTAKVLWVLRKP